MNIKLFASVLIAILIGVSAVIGLKSATADIGDHELEFTGDRLTATVRSDTTFGSVQAVFKYEVPEVGPAVWTVVVTSPFAEVEKELVLVDGDSARIGFEFDIDSVPTDVLAELQAFGVVDCGAVIIRMSWLGGRYDTGLINTLNPIGDPLLHRDRLAVRDVEITTAKVCGLDLLGPVAQTLEGEMDKQKYFDPIPAP